MQPLHETAAQSANNSNTGAPTDSAPQSQPVLETGPGLPIHASAAIFPPMRESEFEALVADIREKGQLEAVWLWQGQVIDGRHRVLACQKLGLTPKTREWDGNGSLLEFIVSANLRRRHLKENQRAMVAARMLPHFEEEAFQRRNVKGVVKSQHGDCSPYPSLGRATDQAGKSLNISGKSVARAADVLKRGIPALIERVDQGRITITAAQKIAEFPPDEQQRLLTLNRRELAAKFRPAKPEKPAEPAKPVTHPGLTEAERARDEMFVKSISLLNYKHVGLKRCEEGLRLKLSMKDWRSELSELLTSEVFPHLLERGVVVIRSDDVEK